MEKIKLYKNRKISFREYLSSIWKYKSIVYSIGFGDIKNRFSRNKIGFFFAPFTTLLTLSVYWIIFGIIMNVEAWGVDYPLFALPGIVIWAYFNSSVNNISVSLQQSENMISKLYFPRINIIFSRLLFFIPELISGIIIFVILLALYNYPFKISLLWFALLFIALVISILGIGIWISIISLYNRDISNTLSQIINFGIFVTPVFYPGTIIPDSYKFLLHINPIAAVIELFRSAAFETFPFDGHYFIGIAIGLILFVSGFFTFKRIENKITDLL